MNTQKQHRQHCSGLLLLLASKKIALLVFFVCLFVCLFAFFAYFLFFICLIIVIILKSDIFLL